MDIKLALTLILAFSLLFIVSSYITSAFFFINGAYNVRGEIVSGGSVNLTFGSPIKNMSQLVIGQPVIGVANNSTANLKMCFGIYCTDTQQPLYSMNFSGFLNYSNGMLVNNTPVTFTIDYFGAEFQNTNFTDNSGNFYVEIDNLPEYVIRKDFNVTIRVQGDVDATYQCWYNHSSSKCCKMPFTPPCQ